MASDLEQLHLGDMEHGLAKPIAVLALEPNELTARTGLKFEVSKDDLDYLHAALFQTTIGTQFALVKHQHAPNPGTDLLVNERTIDVRVALDEALKALEIEASEVTWIHPDIR